MIEISEVLQLHKTLIDQFGGSNGVRDFSALESALSRPFQRFDGKDLYLSIHEKAAALVESVLVNHPFIDGNKRTGYGLLRIFLALHGFEISASTDNKYEFIIDIASGALKFEGIVTWLEANSRRASGG
jgi:death-on-curing protein